MIANVTDTNVSLCFSMYLDVCERDTSRYKQDTSCKIHHDTTGYVSDRKSPPKTIGNPPSPRERGPRSEPRDRAPPSMCAIFARVCVYLIMSSTSSCAVGLSPGGVLSAGPRDVGRTSHATPGVLALLGRGRRAGVQRIVPTHSYRMRVV